VFPADLTLSGEFASFANLFDEVRMDRCELLTSMILQTSTAQSTPFQQNAWAISCDPDDPTAEPSVGNVMIASYHAGPWTLVSNATNANLGIATGSASSSTVAVNDSGFRKIQSPQLPRGRLPLNSSGTTGASPVGGDWVPVTSGAIVGCWFKFYIEPAGPNIIATVKPFIRYQVQWRFRG
jgi:hypothetical protein